MKRYETEYAVFYIRSFSNGTYQVMAYDDKYEYSVSYKDYDILIQILDGMKGIEK